MSPLEAFIYNFGIPIVSFSIGLILLVFSNKSSKSKAHIYYNPHLTIYKVGKDAEGKPTELPKI